MQWPLLVARHPLFLGRKDGEAAPCTSEDRAVALWYPYRAADLGGRQKALRVVVVVAPEITVAEIDDDQVARDQGQLSPDVGDIAAPNGRDVMDIVTSPVGATEPGF